MNKNDFLTRAKAIHGDLYDYSLVDFSKGGIPITIVCRKHGPFKQVPYKHYGGRGCPRCAIEKRNAGNVRWNQEVMVERFKSVHGDTYDYSKSMYNGYMNSITISCRKHGDFIISPNKHVSGEGCRKCGLEKLAKSKLIGTEEFTRRAKLKHGDTYDYSKSIYTGAHNPIVVTCKLHGDFSQMPDHHWGGCGCPICGISSKGEERLLILLEKRNIEFQRQKRFTECCYKYPLPFDFYLPKYNACIEYNGPQHYEYVKHFHRSLDGFQQQLLKDELKREFCCRRNKPFLEVRYDDDMELVLDQFLIVLTQKLSTT
jgi:hypothetical protein